ncbi:MAG TPA: hypothetical protein VFW47_07620 [Phenylobacterium sp.]|nr:hypothetical protein [Phenylobacterium sp.]
MSAKFTRQVALGAVAALALSAISVPIQAQEVSSLQVTAKAPTSIKVEVTGMKTPAVRHVVRIAAVQVCRNAVYNGELDYFDNEWCQGATTDVTMSQYRRAHAQRAQQFASAPEMLVIATR